MKDRCEECREILSYGVYPTKCHIDEDGEHCNAGPCVHEENDV